MGLLRRLAALTFDKTIRVVTAIATHYERHFDVFPTEGHRASVALIVVSMAREERVGKYTLSFADCINLLQHRRAAAVVAMCPTRLRRGGIAERRMVSGKQQGSHVLFLLDGLKLRGQVFQLVVGH